MPVALHPYPSRESYFESRALAEPALTLLQPSCSKTALECAYGVYYEQLMSFAACKEAAMCLRARTSCPAHYCSYYDRHACSTPATPAVMKMLAGA